MKSTQAFATYFSTVLRVSWRIGLEKGVAQYIQRTVNVSLVLYVVRAVWIKSTKKTGAKCFERFWVSWKFSQWKPYFMWGLKLILSLIYALILQCGKISYKKSPHISVKSSLILWNWPQLRPDFFTDVIGITFSLYPETLRYLENYSTSWYRLGTA
jgi:hypothetical protein